MQKVIFYFLTIIVMMSQTTLGQGCSDAGFCTINNVKPLNFWEKFELTKHQIKAGFFVGEGDNSVNV